MNIAYLFFEAKQLIDNFCVSTYGEHADFSDLKKIGIAHATTEDERFPIQVYVNLIEKQVVTQVGNEIASFRHYKSLEDMIDKPTAEFRIMYCPTVCINMSFVEVIRRIFIQLKRVFLSIIPARY